MPLTRHLSILSLIMSAGALILAVAVFFGADPTADNPTTLLLPAQTLAQTLDNVVTSDAEKAKAFWLAQEASGFNYYTHPATGLTFPYYTDFQLMAGEDEGGEIIIVENTEHSMAFQIFIQPWDEPGSLTEDRIRRDLPDMAMEAIIETEFFQTGEPVLTFLSIDETLGYIPEAWFIHNGSLYQIAMHAPGDPEKLLFPWIRGFLRDLTFTP